MTELLPEYAASLQVPASVDGAETVLLDGLVEDPDGNLRKAVPTWIDGENGSQIPVYMELSTGYVFRRVELPTENSSAEG